MGGRWSAQSSLRRRFLFRSSGLGSFYPQPYGSASLSCASSLGGILDKTPLANNTRPEGTGLKVIHEQPTATLSAPQIGFIASHAASSNHFLHSRASGVPCPGLARAGIATGAAPAHRQMRAVRRQHELAGIPGPAIARKQRQITTAGLVPARLRRLRVSLGHSDPAARARSCLT